MFLDYKLVLTHLVGDILACEDINFVSYEQVEVLMTRSVQGK